MKRTVQMTQSLEDYLEAVYMLTDKGAGVQVRAVAELLAVKMPSVVRALKELKKLELVVQEPYQPVALTEKGRRVARNVLGRHTLLRAFLMKLGVTRKTADRDACRMEHILSAETLERIREYTGANDK